MSVILLILKMIGMILLLLLGILLLLVALVLFVPVHYQVSGELEDDKTIHGRISWLLRLVNWCFVYEKGEFAAKKICICGIPLHKKNETDRMDAQPKPDTADEYVETAVSTTEDKCKETTESAAGEEYTESTEPGFFLKIKDTLVKVRNTLFHIKDNISNIKKQITDETNRKAVIYVLSELKYMLQHFRFRKIDTNLTFSLADPATTGQILGILCMMPFMYKYSVRLYPDFETEEAYVRGTFRIVGRVRLIHVLISLVRLIKKQEIRILLNKILKK